MTPDDPALDALSEAVANGADVDWDQAESNAQTPENRELVRELRVLARLSKLIRMLQPDGSSSEGLLTPTIPITEPSSAPPRVPAGDASVAMTTWGPLTVRGEIGSGSFGTVFRAWEPTLEREVALKVLHGTRSSAEDAVVAEARRLAQVSHQNVVTIFGADLFDGRIGFWMEFVQGLTLKQIQTDLGRYSAQEALLYGLDVCRALAAVHRAGFIHCDVKAQNVMRAEGGRIVLMDFGAARLMRAGAEGPSRIAGTPVYLAPELLMDGVPTVRSDLYSLGVLLYYLVTGEFPVVGDSLDELRMAHMAGQRTLLRDARPDLPAAFVRVVDAATAVLPEERPNSAGAMEALLESAAGRVRARSSGSLPGRPEQPSETSIAVLPFADISSDKGLDYFCEGLAEEIIDALTKIPALRVVARSSAFSFNREKEDARHVGSVLNVGTLLQGSVRSMGNRLRVISRLTDTSTGVQFWSERFDRSLDDVFGVQDEIAQATVRALGVRIGREPGRAAFAAPSAPRDAEAYTLYLKGRHCWNQRTEAALHKSASYFHAAIERDPEYGEAYAGLAEAYTTLGLYGVLAPHDIMARAKAAAERAIEMAGHLSSPHATAGCIAAVYDWAWPDAARHYHRAIELTPDHPVAHHWYAINYLVPLRRFEEATVELRRAVEADPLSMPIRTSLGMRSYFAHSFEDARRELLESLELQAGFGTARLFLGLTLTEMDAHDEAVRELETAIHLSGSPETKAGLAYALGRAGRHERACALLDDLRSIARERYVSGSLFAQVHAALGETEPALAHLEAAADAHAVDLAWLTVRPVFDRLRSEPRFNALVARLRL
jgi:TolB-like protein/Tfp pilus assembly protein PilF